MGEEEKSLRVRKNLLAFWRLAAKKNLPESGRGR